MTGGRAVSGPTTAIVLAAGAGSRFGGRKLLAMLDGRPILQHVLDSLALAGIDDPVVVVGVDAQALEIAIDWRRARRVLNPDPERGLASSLRLGWEAAIAVEPRPMAVLVVLGDQPRVGPDVIWALAAEPLDPQRPVVVALHADGARNPVRLEPEADALVAQATGDRGLGPLLHARPELVRTIMAGGANADIDAPGDLVAALADAWAARVRANASQVERLREVPDGPDFYATVTRTFVADPARTDDAVLDALIALARPGDTWLDIGAGAGRYALPLARSVREVIALDPSRSMLESLGDAMSTHANHNIRTIEGRWPPGGAIRDAIGPNPVSDVALIAHVGYDIEPIVPFLDAMEAAAQRLCVAVLMEQSPASIAGPFWPLVHGEPRIPLPALPQFLELLVARGRRPNVMRLRGERRSWADREELLAFLRRQLWTVPGSAADGRLLDAVAALTATGDRGAIEVRGAEPHAVGVVTWAARSSV